jgi:type IX secretion system PorP/SprF family membrane protein
MKLKIYLMIMMITMFCSLQAQDPHFSQYQAAPLTINPAMTGYLDGDSRLSLNFRTQYYSAGGSFRTGVISYEMITNSAMLQAKDQFAIGVIGLFDQSAGGGYRTMNAGVSGSYRKLLNESGYKRISMGAQVVLNSRALNTASLTYASQFASYGFDLSRPNNENIPASSKTYADASVGLMFNNHNEQNRFYAGAALYHLNRPDVSFQNDAKYKLPTRAVLHGGYRTYVGGLNNYVLFNTNVMLQGGASNIMFGGLYGLALGDFESGLSIDMGAWYRMNDAVIPYIGFNVSALQIGVSYDNVLSGLKQASPRLGSFEVSLRYNGVKSDNPFIKNIMGRGF